MPGTPTTRSPAPTANAISVVSEVRQTTRRGYGAGGVPYTWASYHQAPHGRSGRTAGPNRWKVPAQVGLRVPTFKHKAGKA